METLDLNQLFLCCFQILSATIENADVLLQIDNAKLTADDFKNK